MPGDGRSSRRAFLEGLAVLTCAEVALPSRGARGQPRSPGGHGLIRPPVPVPDIAVTRDDGVATTLPELVRHHVTAVQLMFTACASTCPIQGAIFSRVQALMPDQLARGVQLLSLSVDPAADTPQALRRWLKRFHRRPGWLAAAPRPADTERVRALGGGAPNPADNHATEVQIVNRAGELIWRTAALPAAEEIVAILSRV
jgi:protein SCO1/2